MYLLRKFGCHLGRWRRPGLDWDEERPSPRGACIGMALALPTDTCTFTRGPCSLAALEGKLSEFTRLLLVVKVIPLTVGSGAGLIPSVAILCLTRGF